MCALSWHTISDNVDSSIDSIAHDVFTKMSNSRIPWSGDILLNSSSRFVQCQILIKTHALHSGSLWPGRNKIIEPATLINILVLSPQRKLGEKIADDSEISHTCFKQKYKGEKNESMPFHRLHTPTVFISCVVHASHKRKQTATHTPIQFAGCWLLASLSMHKSAT